MPSDPANDITRLLQRHHAGDRDAFDRMVPLVYDQLRSIARRQLARGGPRGPLLDTTSLVQEAYLQLVGEDGPRFLVGGAGLDVDVAAKRPHPLHRPGVEQAERDLLPVMRTLGTVAPDLHDLLDVSRELNGMLAKLPGMGRIKRRVDVQQGLDVEAGH